MHMRMEQCIDDFLNEMKTVRNLSPRTLRAYRYDLLGLCRFIGALYWQRLDTLTIQSYIGRLDQDGLVSSSIKRKVATFKVFFRHLESKGFLERSPMLRFRLPYKIPKQLPRTIPHDELVRLLSAAHDLVESSAKRSSLRNFLASRNSLIVELLFALGIRIDELIQLKDENIDTSTGCVLVLGKGNKERTLFISSNEVRDCVNAYRELRNSMFDRTQMLLVNRVGENMTSGSVGRVFDDLCHRAGLERHYTPHCLRHTMATLLMENGADVRSVQEILGHSSIQTTEIYLHVSAKRKEDVFSRFHERNRLCLHKTSR